MSQEREALVEISGVLEQAQYRNDLDQDTVEFVVDHFNRCVEKNNVEGDVIRVKN